MGNGTSWKAIAGCAAVGLAAAWTPLAAQALIIDDFSQDQTVFRFGSPGTTTNEQAGGGIVGGERDVELELVSGSGVTFVASSGVGSYGQSGSSTARGLFTWDGSDGSPLLDATGLGGVDFTEAGMHDAIGIRMVSNDFAADVTLTVYTDAANFSSVTLTSPGNIPPDPAFTWMAEFGTFAPGGGAGADFSNVGAFSILVDGGPVPSLDFEFDFITTLAAPEPSTLLLATSGLVFLAMLGRRRST